IADLMKNAERYFPDYFYLQEIYSIHLMNRRRGTWETYVAQLADKNKNLGDEIYARIVSWMVHGWGFGTFHDFDLNWPRVWAGYALMETRYPSSLVNLNDEAFLA